MKSEFLTDLILREVDDSHFQLKMVFEYQSVFLGKVISVPVGFITDFASVPRIPFIFYAVGDIAHEPAVIHDFLYFWGYYSRAASDKVFLEAMKVIGIQTWKRFIMYIGVRIGGWKAWNNYRKGNNKNAPK